MKLTLAFSPCPNDTFIFDALVNKKIDTGDFEFDVALEDVQTLNRWTMENQPDISKISYGALSLVLDHYVLLNSGGALGKGVGPLLIAASPIEMAAVPQLNIAIPGENTTANLLFRQAFPSADKKTFMIFHEVEEAVLSGRVDAGVIIHENRFTYREKGLVKLMDLGDFWEKKTGAPIPLGGIVAKRTLPREVIIKIDLLIRQSVEYAFANYPVIPGYVKQHAQEMEESVMKQHIDLYVNNYSIDLGEDGKKAVSTLLQLTAAKDHNHIFIY